MGAYLHFKPNQGEFNTEEVQAFFDKAAFLCRVDGLEKPAYVFIEPKKGEERNTERLQITDTDLQDSNHFAYEHPLVEIRDPTKITLNLNAYDTCYHDMRTMTHWLLAHYQCNGQDFQGYAFNNNDEIHNWLDVWVPNLQ